MTPCRQCGETHAPDVTECPRTQGPVSDGPCGTRIDRYEVERLIASGGMGSVYRARHAMLNQPVALKLLRSELAHQTDVVSRFVQEARAAAAISTPQIVQVTDFGVSTNGVPFLAMELLEGRDLETLLRDEGPLPQSRAVGLMREVLTGLAAAHTAGIVHRDMKPANVFLVGGRNGAPEAVKLLDFGISKVLETGSGAAMSQTRAGTALGTPHYMAPEQFRDARDVDARADIYSVAAMLYQLLTRRLPHEADSYEALILRVCTEAPRPLASVAPHLPAALTAAVDRGLAQDRTQRWPSASAFSDALLATQQSHPLSNTAPSHQNLGYANTAALPQSTAPAYNTPAPSYASHPSQPAAPFAPPSSQGGAQAYQTPPPFTVGSSQQGFAPVPSAPGATSAPSFGQPSSSGASFGQPSSPGAASTSYPHATSHTSVPVAPVQPATPTSKPRSPVIWLIPGVLVSGMLIGAGFLYRSLDEAAGPGTARATAGPAITPSTMLQPPPELTPSLVTPSAFGASAASVMPMPTATMAMPSMPMVPTLPSIPGVDPSAFASALAMASAFSNPSANPFGANGELAAAIAQTSALASAMAPHVDSDEPTEFSVEARPNVTNAEINWPLALRLVENERTSLLTCARPGRGVRVLINAFVNDDHVNLVAPTPNEQQDTAAARCVAGRLRYRGEVEGLGDGIATVQISLPRR